MTGTLAGYRRRGLPRAIKPAANDGENVGMQRLNESLGFRGLTTRREYALDVPRESG